MNPRTLSSPARRASQDSSTPAIQLGLPPLLRPAIVLPRRPPGAPPHPSCQQPCCVLSTDGTAYCPPAAACPEPECGSWLVCNAVSVEVLYCFCCGSPILGSRPIFSCPDCSYDACVVSMGKEGKSLSVSWREQSEPSPYIAISFTETSDQRPAQTSR